METIENVAEFNFRKRLFARHARNMATQELKNNGVTLIAEQLKNQGYQLSDKHLSGWSSENIDLAWKQAEENGFTDNTIIVYASTPEIGAFNDNVVTGVFSDIWQWIVEHKEQILAVVKFILSLLAVFMMFI